MNVCRVPSLSMTFCKVWWKELLTTSAIEKMSALQITANSKRMTTSLVHNLQRLKIYLPSLWVLARSLLTFAMRSGDNVTQTFIFYFLSLPSSVCKLISLQKILLNDYILLKRGSSRIERIDILENTVFRGVSCWREDRQAFASWSLCKNYCGWLIVSFWKRFRIRTEVTSTVLNVQLL